MRIGERVVRAGGVGVLHQPSLHLAEPHPGAFVERPIRDNTIRNTAGHRDRRLLDDRAGRADAVVDLGEEFQLPDTRRPCDHDLGVGVHRERGQSVDVGGTQAGVVGCVEYGLCGEPQFTPARSSWRSRSRRCRQSPPGPTASGLLPYHQCGRRNHMVTKAVAPHNLYHDLTALHRGHLTGERHRVVGVPRHAEPQPD
jgi:hypothetical protein